MEHVPELAGWAIYGQAFVAMRCKEYARAHQLLDKVAEVADATDRQLLGSIALTRGTVFYHEGNSERAMPLLHIALELVGRDSFGTGRVLDAIGMLYAGKDNFHAAREFYQQALECKHRFNDEAGIALSHGQLGRLYLDWGHLELAKQHFEKDLEIAERTLDQRGVAQMHNHLGQLALAQGRREAAAGRGPAALKCWHDAAGWLDETIRQSQGQWPIPEAYARKDRALVYIAEGKLAEAEREAQEAERIFAAAKFKEGAAHVNRVWGVLRRAQGRLEESSQALRAALAHFDDAHEHAEAARSQLEVAHTLRAAGAPRPQVIQALVRALGRAESCRRAELVREIEEELRNVDHESYLAHVYRRVRGRSVSEDTTSLLTGTNAVATALFFDLQGSTEYARVRDPQVVMMTLNQMMADLSEVLQRYSAQVTSYLGDGFMALLRDCDHAERGVNAALDLMAAMKEFNRPREFLGLPQLPARIGIASGPAFIGNVGTYHKMDHTAIGNTVNLAARLQSEAEPGVPCISYGTHELVAHLFTFKPANPRTVKLKGIEEQQVWDVVGRKA